MGEVAGGAVVRTACTNEPNLPTRTRMVRGGRRCQRSRRSGLLRQTNPICPAPAGEGAGRACWKRCQCWGNCAKQTQSCRSDRKGKCFLGKELRRIWPATGVGKTKPISARTAVGKGRQGCRGAGGTHRAEQSQLVGEVQVGSVKFQANKGRRRVLRIFPLPTSDLAVPTRDGLPCGHHAKRSQFPRQAGSARQSAAVGWPDPVRRAGTLDLVAGGCYR